LLVDKIYVPTPDTRCGSKGAPGFAARGRPSPASLSRGAPLPPTKFAKVSALGVILDEIVNRFGLRSASSRFDYHDFGRIGPFQWVIFAAIAGTLKGS
jgi:hypothetical protein